MLDTRATVTSIYPFPDYIRNVANFRHFHCTTHVTITYNFNRLSDSASLVVPNGRTGMYSSSYGVLHNLRFDLRARELRSMFQWVEDG